MLRAAVTNELGPHFLHNMVEHRYRVILPYVVQLCRVMPEGRRVLLVMVICPVSGKRIRRWVFVARNYDLDKPDDGFREVGQLIGEQDRCIVENQRPEELPVDLREEMHLKGPDAASLTYRLMEGADHGLGDEPSQQAYTEVLVHWLREMLRAARADVHATPVLARSGGHAEAEVQAAPAETEDAPERAL